jgi:cytochrome c biogenesis protein CcmG/thiol:disulfide interchange protein DsbE
VQIKKNIKLVLLFILLSFAFIGFYISLFKDKKVDPQVLINKELPDLDGKSLFSDKNINIKNLNLDETFIINIFASWCAPCKVEHPYLVKLKDQNLKIIGINYKDTIKNAKLFLTKYENPYYKVLIDKDSELSINLGAFGVPETYLVNSNNVIILKHIGPIDENFYNSIIKNK